MHDQSQLPAQLSLLACIERFAREKPQQIAVEAPGYQPLRYGRLHDFVQEHIQVLNRLGIGRHDPIAIVIPNGPEMAVALLTITAGAISAPLNPAYSASEYEFYLRDLEAKALVIEGQLDSPARDVAKALNIPIISLQATHEAAGLYSLDASPLSPERRTGAARREDVAVILHTSGTTSKPKMVPLTHENILSSALHISDTLKLSHEDRCLNVMPLFHIHGLIAALMSSLQAGASLVCTPGFSEAQFYFWLKTFQPSWYTAVPTIHQAILTAADRHQNSVARHTLRFIRSSSASLPATLLEGLEKVFKVPVIEAYGMTEASHQIASNPLPPGQRKASSVGVAAGPQVAIMSEDARFLSNGETGEIAIRGLSVTTGYANNKEANEKAYHNGWFRTGDQGYLDEEGYLFITGRLKEMINRGGESIAPREVDDVLTAHPEVAQAITFALPHQTLGEDLVAAVVLRQGSVLSERELRHFAFDHLVGSKVPSQIIIVSDIPKGPTGKIQRLGLADKLATQLKREFVKPSHPLEQALAMIWSEVLQGQRIGVHDNFFALGGDSIKATQVIARVRDNLQVELPLRTVFEEPTIAGMKRLIQVAQTLSQSASSTLTSIKDIELLLVEIERWSD